MIPAPPVLRVPAADLAVVGLLAIVAAAALAGPDALVLGAFTAEGVARGEWWRVLTAHVVHVNAAHAALNAAGLLVLYALFRPWVRVAAILGLTLWLSLVVSAGVAWRLSGEIGGYAGLSGILHGYWAAGVWAAWRARRREAAVAGALLIGKLAWEAVHGDTGTAGLIGAPVVTEAHLYGALGGVAAMLVVRLLGARR